MIHDMTENSKWVHLDTSNKGNDHFINCNDHERIPLAMLLILADELSVWNRPRLKTEDKGSGAVLYSFDTSQVPEEIKLFINEALPRPSIYITADKNSEAIRRDINGLKCLKKKIAGQDKPSVLGYDLDVK